METTRVCVHCNSTYVLKVSLLMFPQVYGRGPGRTTRLPTLPMSTPISSY